MIKRAITHTLTWALRLLIPLGLMAALAWMGRYPLAWEPQEGMLRMAWRLVGTNIRVCRDYTEQERNSLPKHMMLKQHCTTSLLAYRLRVSVNGQPRMDRVVYPPGARGDRPLYVSEDMLLPAGESHLQVSFEPFDPRAEAPTASEPELAHEQAAVREAIEKATVYRLDQTITLHPGRIVLLDLSEENRRFHLLTAPPG